MKIKRLLKTGIVSILALFTVISTGAAKLVYADELHSYESTSIEDDLRDIDVSSYVKDENGRHRLMDEVGFLEYGYSESSVITMNYYGIFLYVYNPTEREVSTQPDANVVNMAVSYNSEGEPNDYANLSLTILDYTDNHRFYKFRVTDSAAVLSRAREYAQTHDGARRYDVAGVQLWFKGDINATDETDDRTERGRTFIITGYAAGCGESTMSESTLKVNTEELETAALDVKKTFYRTKSSDTGTSYQKQIDSVYFSVPKKYIDTYGKLQRIKAEWYEYKTTPIVVTSNSDFYYDVDPYIGVNPLKEGIGGFIEDCGYTVEETPLKVDDNSIVDPLGTYFWNYIHSDILPDGTYLSEALRAEGLTPINGYSSPEDSVGSRTLYYLLHTKDWCDIENYDPLLDVEEQGGVSRSALENYIYNYNKTYDSGTIQIGEKKLSADLFESDIDESRKQETEYGKIQQGYSYYDFDVDTDIHEILTYQPDNHSFAENVTMYGFWRALFHSYGDQVEETENLSPILILSEEHLRGSNETVSKRLKVHINDVPSLREEYEKAVTIDDADDEEKVVVLFRFAVSDYYSSYLFFYKAAIGDKSSTSILCTNSSGNLVPYQYEYYTTDYLSKRVYGEAYYAQESVFLDFDIIQLSFQRAGENELKIIPMRANPIDIINPITPPWHPEYENFWALVFALLGVIAVLIGTLIGVKFYEKHKDKEQKK